MPCLRANGLYPIDKRLTSLITWVCNDNGGVKTKKAQKGSGIQRSWEAKVETVSNLMTSVAKIVGAIATAIRAIFEITR